MAFSEEPNAVPSEIGDRRLILTLGRGQPLSATKGQYRFEVLDEEGNLMRVREGDPNPHLTTAERNILGQAMNILVTKSNATLPGQ